MRVHSWMMTAVREPLVPRGREESTPPPGEVLIEVAGCGVCHTDLGYLYEGVPLKGELPLTLGHEISGRVAATGDGVDLATGQPVVVPAILPCGECSSCKSGRSTICRRQLFPGNDVHGGFASHVRVPAAALCPVPEPLPDGFELEDLAVLADAVTTPYQAIKRSGLGKGDVAVFIGVGGVGGFGVQIAVGLGASVVAVDVDEHRLASAARSGAELAIQRLGRELPSLKKEITGFCRELRLPRTQWKVFETSGTPDGQELAFALLGPGAYVSVIGYTPQNVTVPLSRLMAFDAKVEGNWGCAPELYPEALELVLDGTVQLKPFVERFPMSQVNDVLDAVHRGNQRRRPILIPDFEV